jgi:hypothetical protein
MIKFTARDLKASTIVPPAYYIVQMNKMSETVSKKGNSTNYVIDDAEIVADEFGNTVVKNGDQDIDVAGVPVGKPWWGFNSQVQQLLVPFIEAVLGEKVTDETVVDWRRLEGKRVCVFIENKNVDGRIMNNVTQMYKRAAV